MDYRVTWEIDIEEVESALAAALEAHRIMLDPDSIATVFAVMSPTGQPSSSTFCPKRLAACPAAMAETTDSHVILSLGAGVQSTALALMAVRGELPRLPSPGSGDLCRHRLGTRQGLRASPLARPNPGATLPVHIVRAMRPDGTPVHIREDSEAIVRGDANRFANPPLFVKESVEYTPYRDPAPAGELRGPPDPPRRDPTLRDHAGLCTSVHRRPPGNASQAMYRRLQDRADLSLLQDA